jgi:hypothetical protein
MLYVINIPFASTITTVPILFVGITNPEQPELLFLKPVGCGIYVGIRI